MANNTTAREAKRTAGNGQVRTKDAKPKKGLWARYLSRLEETRCTLTPPECR